MKITFMTGAMYRGGAERVISVLSNYYAERGHEVEICMLLHNEVKYDLNEKIRIVNLSDDTKSLKRGLFALLTRIRRHIKSSQSDVVVSFMAQIAFLTGMATKGLKVRHVASERIDPSQVNRSGIYKKALHNIYAHLDALVLQTERAYNYFPEKIQKRSVIIPNPISVTECASDKKRKRIVTAGRLEAQKNQKMLIKAFSCLMEKYPEYTLDIYGEGSLRKDLQAYIDTKNLSERAILKGNSPTIHHEISDAEIFVLSSDFEGLSNALLEAMMMGLPVISTECSGSDEVIKNGYNGILIPIGDENALISALDGLLSSKQTRESIAKSAALSVEKFKTENVINQWNKVILR